MTIAQTIQTKLEAGLAPVHLEVVNESDNHSVPKGSESHFKVVVASPAFEGRPMLHRHRMVYALLSDELAGGVHALALHTYTPQQWDAIAAAPQSPACHGGMKTGIRTAATGGPSGEAAGGTAPEIDASRA